MGRLPALRWLHSLQALVYKKSTCNSFFFQFYKEEKQSKYYSITSTTKRDKILEIVVSTIFTFKCTIQKFLLKQYTPKTQPYHPANTKPIQALKSCLEATRELVKTRLHIGNWGFWFQEDPETVPRTKKNERFFKNLKFFKLWILCTVGFKQQGRFSHHALGTGRTSICAGNVLEMDSQ